MVLFFHFVNGGRFMAHNSWWEVFAGFAQVSALFTYELRAMNYELFTRICFFQKLIIHLQLEKIRKKGTAAFPSPFSTCF